MLGCDKTVTLIRKDAEDAYTQTVINGVSWFEKLAVTAAEGGGVKSANVIKVRIPSGAGITEPKAGDVVVLGEVTEAITKPSDLRKYQKFTALSVSDNRGDFLSHWAVSGA